MKKLLSMLMAFVLVIGLVPAIAASAAEGECDHTGNHWRYESNHDGTHKVICDDCDAAVDVAPCYIENGKCVSCSYEAPAPCDHDHTKWGYKSHNNGTHDVICKCGEVMASNVQCVTESGSCACGYEAPASCDHDSKKWDYKPNNDGTHNVVCECGKVIASNAKCVFENGKACICGNTCGHVGAQPCTPVDGTHHKVTCAECGKVLSESVACVFENGKPCACGNKAPVSCDHVNKKMDYTPHNNGTHDVICECGKVIASNAKCVFENGKACACGNTCDHIGTHDCIPVDGTHHKVVCPKCDKVLNASVDCVFEDGKPCACGNKASVACDHVGAQECIPLDATHHKVVCPKCGVTVEKCVDCVFENGVCDCGNKKPVHGNTNDKNLDNVPKTSDVLAPVMILSGLLSAAGFVTKKRFF